MSKAIPTKKKVGTQSSTESSSGSSSDSSSSSSSSSGSDSSSSSDSDSSSSQGSSKANSGSEHKKSAAIQKIQRKSIECHPKSSATKPVDKPNAKTKQTSTQKSSQKGSIYSSEDEDGSKLQGKAPPAKRKNTTKPKNTATITPKVVGNKPPNAKASAKTNHMNKANKASVNKEPSKSTKQPSKSNSKIDANKKKSIFSPENSSASDTESSSKAEKVLSKTPAVKPRPKAMAKVIEKPKPVEKQKTEKPVPKSKPIVSSASSASSSTESSSSSDSDSSADSNDTSKNQKKKSAKKSQKETNTDSESENINKQITRKLTRSASTRKSKHVLGKNVYTDTDSDTESVKRSLSRSPVKRVAISTKGKAKNNKRSEIKPRSNEITLDERKCPVENCSSSGHMSGKQEQHFTIDACPMYHNTNFGECKDHLAERRKREDFRRKAMECFKKSPRPSATAEQKQYLQKIKDLRAKFKIEDIDEKPSIDKNREPVLTNFVPDYDLKLFRDAQAISSEKIEEDLKTQPNTKGTKYIEMGKFEMEVWYQSPYPEDFARLPKLYICEFCLRYMKSRTILQRHVVKCVWRHPPGEEVYRKDKISVWEVDGKRYKQYCQNLCLLAKFFLDHKTLYYDVEPFLFYVMTMYDTEGCHTVGYFSKEKNSFLNYNVSCILTLPPYQRQGYGRLLIDFSYLLTRVEGKIGSPEKPLSDLGLISYRSYWKDVLLGYICYRPGTSLSVKDISQEMAIHSYDIVSTLQALGMMKYWKGKHIILKKQDVMDEYLERVKRRGSLLKEVDPVCLRWKPFVPAQPNPV